MREKQLRLITTFHNTTSAIAMEKRCREAGVAGRLIPLPGEISAGCGLAWSCEPELREQVIRILEANELEMEQMVELYLS